MSTITRLYTSADTEQIMELIHDTVHAINSRDYNREQVNAWAPHDLDRQLWMESLTESLEAHQTYVAVVDETIIGFGDYADDGHLDRFYVHKDYQRKGVGSLLLTRLEAVAKTQGINRFFTEASITAKQFFLNRGFSVIQEQQVQLRGVTFTNFRMEKSL